MELPSVTIRRVTKYTNPSTLTSRNIAWFKNFYYQNRNEQGIIQFNQNGNKFVIGTCYSFFYFNPKYKEELPFWSSVPVGIFLGYHQTTKHPLFLGLMFIPPKIREEILDKITSINRSRMDGANRQINKRGETSVELDTDYYDLKKYLKKSGFEFAIRTYIVSRINSKPLIITYQDWWRIPTFPSKYVNKMDLRAIYYLYKKNIGIDPFKKGGEKKQGLGF